MNMACPGCGTVYEFTLAHSETQVQCVKCQLVFAVPHIPGAPQKPAASQQVPQPTRPQQPTQQQHPAGMQHSGPSMDPGLGPAMPSRSGGQLPSSRKVSSKNSSSFNPTPFILGGVGILVFLICGGCLFSFIRGFQGAAGRDFAEIHEPVPAYTGALPERPTVWSERIQGRSLPPIPYVIVDLEVPVGEPGQRDKVWVFLPPKMPTEAGAVKPRSQACVFFCPAGASMFSGMYMGMEDLPEIIPYAMAGYIVVAYEQDGYVDNLEDPEQLARGFPEFKQSRAGIVNAEHAIQYTLANFPEIDPGRLYAAGHSSGGTMTLRLAAHDNRIKACLAYAPPIDPMEGLDISLQEIGFYLGDSGAGEFIEHYSPLAQEDRIKCDVFLFHARDDSMVSFQSTEKAAQRMSSLSGREVKFVAQNSGGHHASMIEAGIPAGIEFLDRIDAKNKSR